MVSVLFSGRLSRLRWRLVAWRLFVSVGPLLSLRAPSARASLALLLLCSRALSRAAASLLVLFPCTWPSHLCFRYGSHGLLFVTLRHCSFLAKSLSLSLRCTRERRFCKRRNRWLQATISTACNGTVLPMFFFFFFEQIQNANRTGQSQAIGSVTARERHVTRSGPGRSWEQLRWADGAVARVTADASEKKSPSSRREGERRRRSQRAVPGQSPRSRHRSKKRAN